MWFGQIEKNLRNLWIQWCGIREDECSFYSPSNLIPLDPLEPLWELTSFPSIAMPLTYVTHIHMAHAGRKCHELNSEPLISSPFLHHLLPINICLITNFMLVLITLLRKYFLFHFKNVEADTEWLQVEVQKFR